MRTPAPCNMRSTSTNDTRNRTDGTHRAGITWRAIPRTIPRPATATATQRYHAPGASPLPGAADNAGAARQPARTEQVRLPRYGLPGLRPGLPQQVADERARQGVSGLRSGAVLSAICSGARALASRRPRPVPDCAWQRPSDQPVVTERIGQPPRAGRRGSAVRSP
jgi:hypothetical protein